MLPDLIGQLKLETYNFSSHSVGDREKIICGFDFKNLESIERFKKYGVKELVPFVTCGRIEFIYFSDRFLGFDGFEKLSDFEAIEHLVSVVSGVSSLVVGETQIVSQFKKAFYDAISTGLATTKIFSIFSEVMRIEKRVRSELNIPSLSFGSVVKGKSLEVFGDTSDKVLFVIGTGEVAHDIYRISKSFKKTLIFSRKKDRAEQKVKKIQEFFGADSEFICSIEEGIKLADVVVVATGHFGFLIKPDFVKNINKKKIFFDLSVPRNISPDVCDNENILLYNVDSFRRSIADFDVIELAKKIIKSEIDKLKSRVEMERKVKDIATLKNDFQKIIADYTKKYLNIPEDEIEDFSKSLSNRLLARFFEDMKSADIFTDLQETRSVKKSK